MSTAQPLTVERLPDEFGPQLRCRGELTAITVGPVCDELVLFAQAGHPAALILDLSDVCLGDIVGSVHLLEALRNLAAAHRHVALVIKADPRTAPLQALKLGTIYPVFPSPNEARAWLRGGVEAGPGLGAAASGLTGRIPVGEKEIHREDLVSQ